MSYYSYLYQLQTGNDVDWIIRGRNLQARNDIPVPGHHDLLQEEFQISVSGRGLVVGLLRIISIKILKEHQLTSIAFSRVASSCSCSAFSGSSLWGWVVTWWLLVVSLWVVSASWQEGSSPMMSRTSSTTWRCTRPWCGWTAGLTISSGSK